MRGQFIEVSSAEVERALTTLGKSIWIPRFKSQGSVSFDKESGKTSLTNVVVWFLLEERVDFLLSFFSDNFGPVQVREHQINKIRVEISAFSPAGGARMRLSYMFGIVEGNKGRLGILDYSISQTSLEQIFNQFAAQQEEETGAAAGIVRQE